MGNQFGGTPGAGAAHVEDVPGHAFKDRTILGEGRGVAPGHHCHPGRASAYRSVQHVYSPAQAGLGNAAKNRWRVGGHVNVGAAGGQSGQDTVLRVQDGGFHLGRAGQRGKNRFAGRSDFPGIISPGGPHLAEVGGGFPADVMDGQLMTRVDEAADHWVTHGAGADKA